MQTITTLPSEIFDNIAERCVSKDLISLCCTSKWVNKLCSRVLYRHVDLRRDRDGLTMHRQFLRKLLTSPEYGRHVRVLKGLICAPGSETTMSEKELWRAVQSLTNVQSVDVGSEFYSDWQVLPMDHFPNDLFQSATSVTLVGRMQYGLVKSILNAVNPATLQYFCLDVVYESLNEQVRNWYNDKRIKALGAPSGLLSILTGRCVALRTLILRRKVHKRHFEGMLAEAEEYSYEEWASFIRSVQGTVEQFTFEQAELFPETPSSHFLDHGISPHRIMDCYSIMDSRYRYMDERFRRVILPTIVSGKWPCLTMIELVGVRNPNGEAGDATLIKQLQALIAGDTTVVVKENAELVEVRQLTGS